MLIFLSFEIMKIKKASKTTLLMILILLSAITIPTILIKNKNKDEENVKTDSESIKISENADFERLNIDGEGTFENPYMIKNLRFSNYLAGICIRNTTAYFTITNCEFLFNTMGILIVLATGRGNISKNFFYGSKLTGLEIVMSRNLIIAENQFHNDGMYFLVNNFQAQKITLKDNKINGKKLGYFVARKNLVIQETEEYGQLIFINCSNFTVEKLVFSNTSIGLQIYNCKNSIVKNCTFMNNNYGLKTHYSSTLNINDCLFLTNNFPIYFDRSQNFSLERNHFLNNEGSAMFWVTHNSIIQNNTFSSNHRKGLELYSSSYNKISFNNFSWNSQEGVGISGDSMENTIHHNIFQLNNPQAFSDGQNNIWFDSFTDHGNWWSDYSGDDAYLVPGPENTYDLFPHQLSELFH